MPICGFHCKRGGGAREKVPFDVCLRECATLGPFPPCGTDYSILRGIALHNRQPAPLTETTVTQITGCLTKTWLERTTPEIYVRPEAWWYRFRGQIAHLVAARYPYPGAVVERRFRAPLNGGDWTISGQPDTLEPFGLAAEALPDITVPPRKKLYLAPWNAEVWPEATCAHCDQPPLFVARYREQQPPAYVAALCAEHFEAERTAARVYHRLLEWKTTRWVPKEIYAHHQRQLIAYFVLAEKAGLPVRDVRAVYMDMGMQRTISYPLPLSKVPQYWQEWLVPQAEDLLTALNDGFVPEPGPLHEDWECSRCDVAFLCGYRTRKQSKPRRKGTTRRAAAVEVLAEAA